MPAEECQYKLCPTCHKNGRDKSWLSLDGIANGDIPPTAATAFSFSYMRERPLLDPNVVKNLGYRAVPIVRASSLPLPTPFRQVCFAKTGLSQPKKAAFYTPPGYPWPLARGKPGSSSLSEFAATSDQPPGPCPDPPHVGPRSPLNITRNNAAGGGDSKAGHTAPRPPRPQLKRGMTVQPPWTPPPTPIPPPEDLVYHHNAVNGRRCVIYSGLSWLYSTTLLDILL